MKKLLLLITSIALSSCGGGGGGGGNSIVSSSGSLSISGVAAKGALIGADVQAYEVVNGVLVAYGAPVKTDSDGGYTLTNLSSTTNPIVVKVVVNSTTTMRDETQAPGSDGRFPLATYAPKAGTEMRTAIQSLTTNTEVHITPFTEMALAAAVSSGSISSSSIYSGQDQVLQLIGMSPFNVQPITNSNVNNSLSQKRMMLYLACINNNAKNTPCSGDASGISCMILNLNEKAKGTLDLSGNFVPTSPAALKSLVTDGCTGLTIPASSPMSSLDLTTEKNKVAVISASNPVQSSQTATLDSFLNIMRTGFNTAIGVAQKYTGENGVKSGLHTMASETTKDGLGYVGRLLRNCFFNSASLLECGTKNDPWIWPYQLNNTYFDKAGAGNTYTFNFTEGNYSYQGTVKGVDTLGALSLLITAQKTDITKNKRKMSDLTISVSGKGLIDSTSSASISFDTFVAKAYYEDDSTNTQYGTVSLTGLAFTGIRTGNKLDLSVPITLTDYAGDIYSGTFKITANRIDKTILQRSYWAITSLGLDLYVKSASTSIVSFSITGTQSGDFNSTLSRSVSNDPKESITINAKFSDNVTIAIGANESVWGTTTVDGRITSNGNWIQIDYTQILNNTGNTVVDSNGIKLTSSGVYSATLSKANNIISGNILQGTTKIGVIANNIMQINGRELSFK